VFVGILVGRYGCEDASGYSATHLEFIAAENNNPDKMLIFIEAGLEKPAGRAKLKLPRTYNKLLNDLTGSLRRGRMIKFFKSWEELAEQIVNQIAAYCANTLHSASHGPSRRLSRSPWELMTFTERAAAMRKQFKEMSLGFKIEQGKVVQTLKQDFGKGDRYRYRLGMRTSDTKRSVPVLFSVCPDRFSYPDAARHVGYPFRTRTDEWADRAGPLDIILLFRGITDTQIRRHLGNPDIEIVRERWGYFAVDPEQAIQVAYLTECDAPPQVGRRVRDFLGWLSDSGQWRRLADRAKSRGAILRAEHPSFKRNGRPGKKMRGV